MASDKEKGVVRVTYRVDDADLKRLDEGQARIEAVGAAAVSTSPEIVALAEATKRATAAAREEAKALGLSVGEYRRLQKQVAATTAAAQKEAAARAAAAEKEAVKLAESAEKEAAARTAAEKEAAAAIQAALDREVAARAEAEARKTAATEAAASKRAAIRDREAAKAAAIAEKEARQQDRVIQASVNTQVREETKAAAEKERQIKKAARIQEQEAKKALKIQEEAGRKAAAAARTAAQETEKAAGAASRGITGIGQQLSDVASQLSTGTNPLTILVQQGPQIAGVAAEAGFGLATLAQGAAAAAAGAASLGIIAVTLYGALGPLSDAIGDVAGRLTGLELEPVTEAMQAQRRAAAILAQSHEDLSPILDDTREKQRELAVLTGQITEGQAKLQKASEDAFGRYQDSVEATRRKLAELGTEQSSVTTQMVDTAESIIPAWTPLGYALRNLTSSSEDYREEIMAGEAALQTQWVALDENVGVNQRLIVETEKAKETEKGRKNALKESSRSAKDYERGLEDLARALAKFAEVQRDAESATRLAVIGLEAVGQTGAAKVYADLNSELEKLSSKQAEVVIGLEAEREAALKATHSQEQRVQVISAANAAITAVEGQYAQERILASEQAEAEITAIILKQGEERVRAAEEGLQLRQQVADRQAAIFEQGAEDAKRMADAEMEAAATALRAAQQVADAIGEVFARQQAAAEQALSETQGNLERIQGLLDGLSTATVDAASLSGQALMDAYASGEVAAEDLTETQRSALERQLQAEEKAAKVREKAQKEAALAAWEAQHAAAVASSLINIPLAVSQTLASVPYPANIPLAILAGGLAAAAAAEVAMQEPPSFRSGYMPDQRLAYIEPQSEIVAPASAVQALGGHQAARDAFAGVSPTAAQKTVVMLGHRELNAMLINSAGRPGKLRDLTKRPGAGLRRPFG